MHGSSFIHPKLVFKLCDAEARGSWNWDSIRRNCSLENNIFCSKNLASTLFHVHAEKQGKVFLSLPFRL